MVSKLTVKQCEKLQIRRANAFGDRWPYKGLFHASGSPYPCPETPELPEGYEYRSISSWGLHVQRTSEDIWGDPVKDSQVPDSHRV